MFPAARYVVQRDEVAALTDAAVVEYAVQPLLDAGRLHQVDGVVGLTSGPAGRIIVVPTPGHTVGHQSVLVESGDRQVVITGDVLAHAVQLVDPDVGYVFEHAQETARRTRVNLIADARDRRAVLATNHLTTPFIDPA
jgi:glyoxylase-like metal-dependent hydrolase (beta-lactamase superfamily II)